MTARGLMRRGEAGWLGIWGADIIVGQGGLKIMIGAAVTALLAWALHGPAGQGEAFMADLHARSTAGLVTHGLAAVQIAYPDAPYARTAHLSGSVGPAERDRAMALIDEVDGSAGAVWRGVVGRNGAVAPKPAAALAPTAVLSCQHVVDAALAGRVMEFRSGSAWLNPQSRQIIADVAAALRTCGGYALEIGGLVQGSGTVTHRAIAQERATRVRDALIVQGVPAGAVTARGYKADGGNADQLISLTVTEEGA